MNTAFDTLTTADDLISSGFDAKQAKAIALAIRDSQGELVTLESFKNAVTRLENQIRSLDEKFSSQFKAQDDKIDSLDDKFSSLFKAQDDKFSSQFKALDDKIDSLDDKFSSQFKALNDKLDYQAISQRWMFGILAAIVLGQLVINYTA